MMSTRTLSLKMSGRHVAPFRPYSTVCRLGRKAAYPEHTSHRQVFFSRRLPYESIPFSHSHTLRVRAAFSAFVHERKTRKSLSADYWEFSTDQKCLHLGNATTSNCTFFMAFCKPLQRGGTNCTNAGICQMDDDNPENVYRIGGYRQNPFVEQDTNGFFAGFPNGQSFTTSFGKPCNLSILIEFKCNQNALWRANIDTSTVNPSEAPNPTKLVYHPTSCAYQLTFDYAGACQKISPATMVTSLSAGTVLIIIFFVSLFVYFLFGSLANACVFEQTGAHIIPNYDFWIMLPTYIVDGFTFTFSCMCCRETNPSHYEDIE
ncbi:uncharacterized protein LOC106165683 isoform X2 [Lingula anatina]|uniref:Autophagy-related protein 27 n=1 Tax=Lingula anatina TaxID=7574 RepID=A0A1S3ING0_LINAN|nr:uncharacterized protein LOC106165683 isoform X2 [Lingula anatina]|eukprot:XP_013399436.1 uncharacterized protein LOC106165683 isoform X2 [Lingula anatina]